MATLEEHRIGSAAEPGTPALTPAKSQTRGWQAPKYQAGTVLVGLLALAAWEAGVRLDVVSGLLFPAPSKILASAWQLALAGTLGTAVLQSVVRMGLGVLIGGTAGLIVGLLMGYVRPLGAILDPIIAAIHPIPKIAIFPLILVFFGMGESSKLVITSLAAFFPVLIGAMSGVRSLPPAYFDVARNYGASRWLTIRRVVLPGSLPFVGTGVMLAINLALLLTISVEMIGANDGLGGLIWRAWQTMRTEQVYVGLGVIVVLGVTSNALFRRLGHRLTPWQAKW
jgi:NitT/TauT family transport system permease protein